MTALNMQQALSKMAAGGNVGAPVKTAPAGQPKVAPVPGNSGNATTASGNPTVAPGPVAHSNATSASGKPKLDSAPEGGAKGKSNEGVLAMSKKAGFAMGLSKAAAAASDMSQADDIAEALVAEGIHPDVLGALDTLSAHGIEVEMPSEFTEKVAKVEARFLKSANMHEGEPCDDDKKPAAKGKEKMPPANGKMPMMPPKKS